ncbi:5'/3'-nucleotidase SurE [bacterium]|nr:5'/3'-nucleotidase SurE [bacterium]
MMRSALTLILILAAVPPATVAEPWFDRVLITNDDGIDDPRLVALAQAFAEVAEVVVVAPLGNCSGSTNYVSAFQRHEVAVESRDLGPGIEAWGVDGFPGDCVLLALTGMMEDDLPDLVLSGINSGPNLADAYLASGTIGAARLATQLGVPAIAFSNLDPDDPTMLAAVPGWCVELASGVVAESLEPGRYLSVNFPDGPADRVQGVCWAAPGNEVFHDAFEPGGTDDQGRRIWKQRWWFDDGDDQPAEGDVAKQRAGWITVTPMRLGDLDVPALNARFALPVWASP